MKRLFFWGQWRIRFVAVDRSGTFLALVFSAGRENPIGRNDRPPCLLRLLARRLPLDGSANVQTLPAGVSLPPACPAKDTAATVATTTDCKRCPDAASSPASSTIPPIKGPIALQSIDLILLWLWFIYLFGQTPFLLFFGWFVWLVGWMIFSPFSWILYAWNSISCRITVYTHRDRRRGRWCGRNEISDL
jgi:hypothetical protein